jgi:hypothetical protein
MVCSEGRSKCIQVTKVHEKCTHSSHKQLHDPGQLLQQFASTRRAETVEIPNKQFALILDHDPLIEWLASHSSLQDGNAALPKVPRSVSLSFSSDFAVHFNLSDH